MARQIRVGVWAGVVILAGGLLSTTAETKPLAGYKCMMLNITEQQSMDPVFHIAVRAQPSASSQVVGSAGSVVIIREPAKPVNGFLEMLLPNGHRVWIAADAVRPYHSLGAPNAKCVPEVLSNGAIGFGSHG
jgi:hypothetical protein